MPSTPLVKSVLASSSSTSTFIQLKSLELIQLFNNSNNDQLAKKTQLFSFDKSKLSSGLLIVKKDQKMYKQSADCFSDKFNSICEVVKEIQQSPHKLFVITSYGKMNNEELSIVKQDLSKIVNQVNDQQQIESMTGESAFVFVYHGVNNLYSLEVNQNNSILDLKLNSMKQNYCKQFNHLQATVLQHKQSKPLNPFNSQIQTITHEIQIKNSGVVTWPQSIQLLSSWNENAIIKSISTIPSLLPNEESIVTIELEYKRIDIDKKMIFQLSTVDGHVFGDVITIIPVILTMSNGTYFLRSLLDQTKRTLNENFENLDDIIAFLKEPPVPLTAEIKKNYWEQIKIEGTCRTFSAIYSVTILYLLISINVNIISRNEIQQILDDGKAMQFSKTLKLSALRCVRYFQAHGIKKLVKIIRDCVRKYIGKISLTEQITAQTMFKLITNIQNEVEAYLVKSLTQQEKTNNYAVPNVLATLILPAENDKFIQDLLPSKNLEDELRDIVESVGFFNVFQKVIGSSYLVLNQKIAKIFHFKVQKQAAESREDLYSVHFAHIVPIFTKQSEYVFNNSPNNEYLIGLEKDETLKQYTYLINYMNMKG